MRFEKVKIRNSRCNWFSFHLFRLLFLFCERRKKNQQTHTKRWIVNSIVPLELMVIYNKHNWLQMKLKTIFYEHWWKKQDITYDKRRKIYRSDIALFIFSEQLNLVHWLTNKIFTLYSDWINRIVINFHRTQTLSIFLFFRFVWQILLLTTFFSLCACVSCSKMKFFIWTACLNARKVSSISNVIILLLLDTIYLSYAWL